APPTPASTTPAAPVEPLVNGANRVDPTAAARDLERALRRQRLWASVEVIGTRVDVRSSACSDAGMAPMIDAARGALKTAGLTRLRCFEQSGALVFERDL
ncbi:MAG: hypothetical protein H0X17_21755, partial [Deltaproteobacteria bacterium]|nr:hypothetical protein [Deltaproteobacteria bacterium]